MHFTNSTISINTNIMDRNGMGLNEFQVDTKYEEINLLLLQSLQFVIVTFFQRATTSFVITISCREANTLNLYKRIVGTLFRTLDDMEIQLVTINNGRPDFIAGRRYFNLYLVDSLQAFLDADPIKYAANYNTNEYYYIILGQQIESKQDILNYCWRHQLINCNVQIQSDNGRVLVYSYFPYTPHHCGHVQLTLINEFQDNAMVHATIFPKKLLNFYRCRMRVATWHIPPFMSLTISSRGRINIAGFEGHLLKELARHYNFTIEIVKLMNHSMANYEGNLIIGDFIGDALNKLKNRQADMTLGYLRQNSERNGAFTSLFAHHQVLQVLCVLRYGQNFTSFEIFGFPFRAHIWYTSLLTLLSIFLLMLGTSNRRIIRTKLSNLFDLIAIAIGSPILNMPQSLHMRLFYISWSFGTFVLRSIYIALLYELFCRNLYRKPPQNIEELTKLNYSIVLNKDALVGVSGIKLFKDRLLRLEIIDSINETAAFAFLEQETQQKLAAMGSREMLLHYGRENRKPGKFQILPQVVMNQALTVYLTKHSFLADDLNQYLLWIQAVGLMERWLREELDLRYFRSTHMDGDKFIGQKELNGIYIICTGFLGLAFLVFLYEICIAIKLKGFGANSK